MEAGGHGSTRLGGQLKDHRSSTPKCGLVLSQCIWVLKTHTLSGFHGGRVKSPYSYLLPFGGTINSVTISHRNTPFGHRGPMDPYKG